MPAPPTRARRRCPQTFLLMVKADLENVGTLSLAKGKHICLDVKESAGNEQRNGVYVSANDNHELAGSKGTANVRGRAGSCARSRGCGLGARVRATRAPPSRPAAGRLASRHERSQEAQEPRARAARAADMHAAGGDKAPDPCPTRLQRIGP
jgi:hypothetical protein